MNISNLPEVTFCELDADQIQKEAFAVYEAITGRTLSPGNPERLFLESLILVIVQQRAVIDKAGKMNLLAYGEGYFLDHMGLFGDTPRIDSVLGASTSLKFSMEEAIDVAVSVPSGTKATSEDGSIVFATTEYAEITPGLVSVEVDAVCTEDGAVGNGFLAGQINKLVDNVPGITAVENTTLTSGGTDVEDDDSYRDRIHRSPSKYSTAGPSGAYDFWARTAHPDIVDVAVYRENPLAAIPETSLDAIMDVLDLDREGLSLEEKQISVGNTLSPSLVNVNPLLEDGQLPSVEIIGLVDEILSSTSIRPLTDRVRVAAPEVVAYDLDFTYYVSTGDIPAIASIQTKVAQAVLEYRAWQRGKIRRDINPDELIRLVKNAGAKRLEVRSPAFTVLGTGQVAHENTISVVYGGAENE